MAVSAEPLVAGIGKVLKEKGYLISDSFGKRVDEPRGDTIGILKVLPPTKGFFGTKVQAPIFLGKISTKDFYTGSTSKWIFEVYGKDHLAEAEEIKKILMTRYEKTEIRIVPK